jgi:hypothetical protein
MPLQSASSDVLRTRARRSASARAARPEETGEARSPDRLVRQRSFVAWTIGPARPAGIPARFGCLVTTRVWVLVRSSDVGAVARRARAFEFLPVDRSGAVRTMDHYRLRVPVASRTRRPRHATDVEHQRQHKPDGVDGVDAVG